MEDALVHVIKLGKLLRNKVLILVLMEDALVPGFCETDKTRTNSLNPCFNGRCTRT